MNTLKNLLLSRTQLPTIISGLDAYSLRQKVIADNIANVETKGFQASEVSFEEDFRKALEIRSSEALTRTDDQHIPSEFATLNVLANIRKEDKEFTNGINNVNIDDEIAELTKAQIKYDAMTKLAKKQFSLLKGAIKGHM